MVGPWQTPVSNVAVTATSLTPNIETGEAMAMGEKPTIALISPAASARMAVGEALMNIAAAHLLNRLEWLVLSANWMAASKHPGEGAARKLSSLARSYGAPADIEQCMGLWKPSWMFALTLGSKYQSAKIACQ